MLRVLLALRNILCVREFCVSHNVDIYCLRFLETAFRLLDHFGLHWIKIFELAITSVLRFTRRRCKSNR